MIQNKLTELFEKRIFFESFHKHGDLYSKLKKLCTIMGISMKSISGLNSATLLEDVSKNYVENSVQQMVLSMVNAYDLKCVEVLGAGTKSST
jgi:hypothetical protein